MSSDVKGILGEKRGAEGRWLHVQGWSSNPFSGEETKLPDPRAFVGYKDQLRQVVTGIDDSINSFVTGSYGLGKTTFVGYVLDGLPKDEFKASFVEKPSGSAKNLFNKILSDISATYNPNDTVGGLFSSLVQTTRKLKSEGVGCVIAVDEVADASAEILQWLRVVSDEGVTFLFSGFPETPTIIREKFFPLYDRVFKTVELGGLEQPEVLEFVARRIRLVSYSSDWDRPFDQDLTPFQLGAIEVLADSSGGAPRYLMRACYDAIRWLIENDKHSIDELELGSLLSTKAESVFGTLTRKQKDIVELIFKKRSMNSSEIAQTTQSSTALIDGYLKQLEQSEIIRKVGKRKAYEYALTPLAERFLAKEERS